jgi:hypothetical protein
MAKKISAVKIVQYDDMDILNQGTVTHIKNYFDKLEKHSNTTSDDNINTVSISPKHKRLISLDSKYSINKISFFVKLMGLVMLLIIVWDFLSITKLKP